ncbi:hypothetical protein AB0945_31815 [Streptomyces sp. NPDC005474]|uniref:hypothetical protein n=1 Tax=Streptomyces sp. NPDC005474 TaxID=3154878 RepID=UPI003456EDC3
MTTPYEDGGGPPIPRPETAHRLHAAEQAISSADPAVRERAIQEAGEIVQAAHREVAGG